jgi:hypothetical protein
MARAVSKRTLQVAAVDRVQRLAGIALAEPPHLFAAARIERNVGVALQPGLDVPVGLAMPDQQHPRRVHPSRCDVTSGPAESATPLCGRSSQAVQRVGAGEGGRAEHAAGQRGAHVVPGEHALDRQPGLGDGVQREHVVVHQRVVERRKGAVVAEVLPAALGVAGEPAGVVVQALARAIDAPPGRACRAARSRG